MHRYQHLIVALTRTSADEELIRYAASIVRLGSVKVVYIAQVFPSSVTPLIAPNPKTALAELLSQTLSHFVDMPVTPQLSYKLLSGPLLDRLLTAVSEKYVDPLLMGHDLDSSRSRALTRWLAMKAPCSVLMVSKGRWGKTKRILVPVDFSRPAADSVAIAASLARIYNMKIRPKNTTLVTLFACLACLTSDIFAAPTIWKVRNQSPLPIAIECESQGPTGLPNITARFQSPTIAPGTTYSHHWGKAWHNDGMGLNAGTFRCRGTLSTDPGSVKAVTFISDWGESVEISISRLKRQLVLSKALLPPREKIARSKN